MAKSKNVTVTDYRLAQALKKGNNIANSVIKSETETVKEEVEQNVKLKLAKVLKYYPGSDKVVIEFVESGKTARCVLGHSIIGTEVSVAYTPQGTLQFDDTFKEYYVPPVNPLYCLVLDIRKADNLKEQCVLCFVSTTSMKIPPSPDIGEYKIQVLDSSITVKNGEIKFKTPKVTVNDLELNQTVDTSEFVTTSELNTKLETLKKEILEEINNGTS